MLICFYNSVLQKSCKNGTSANNPVHKQLHHGHSDVLFLCSVQISASLSVVDLCDLYHMAHRPLCWMMHIAVYRAFAILMIDLLKGNGKPMIARIINRVDLIPVSLIGVEGGNATRISRFANYLRNLLPSSDPVVMEMASKAMGHLSMAGDTFTAEYVEFEVKRALEWLGADRNEGRRHASVSGH